MYEHPASQGRPLAEFALALAEARGKAADAEYHGERFASPRVQTVLRAVAGTINPGSPGWGIELADAQIIQDGFFAALRFADAFDRMLVDMRRLPARTRLVANTSVASSAPGEGESKTIGQLSLADGQLDPLKAQCTCVVSQEIARAPGAVDFLNSELQAGIATSTDSAFIAAISDGAPSIAASGTDAEALRYDIGLAIASIAIGAASRPFVLMSPARALAISLMSASGGGQEFPGMTPSGGEISGITVLATDGTTTDIAIADASGLAADPGELLLSAASHASVDMGGGLVSLWSQNLLGLRAERHFAASAARPGAVAVITGANYGPQGDTSP
jgi:hypothetical protein